MSQINQPNPAPQANPVELTAAAVNHLVRKLPSGTAYCIAIVFIVMMTGRLVSTKGSLALSVLSFVHHLKWLFRHLGVNCIAEYKFSEVG